jgi:hypothetical protein
MLVVSLRSLRNTAAAAGIATAATATTTATLHLEPVLCLLGLGLVPTEAL